MKTKLRTHGGFAKRFRIVGNRNFKFFKFKRASGHHLMRNKSKRNKISKRRGKILATKGDIKHARRLMPYYKKKKSLI